MVPSLRAYFAINGSKHLILILWFSINALLFYYTFMYYYTGVQFYYLHQMLGYGLCISRASAACINMNSSLLLIPMCKRLITYIRGFKQIAGSQCRRVLDRGRMFHIYCGYILCLLALIHCGAHMYNAIYFSKHFNEKYQELNVAKYANQNPLVMLVTTLPGITGLLLVATLVIIAVFASKPIRLKKYNQFWKTHHLFAIYYILLFLHSLDGVIKYQSNVKHHVPGCYMIVSMKNSSESESIVFPEPEPHAEPISLHRAEKSNDVNTEKRETSPFMEKQKSLLSNKVVIPEPEPMLKGDALSNISLPISFSHGLNLINVDGSLVSTKQCEQPPPEFKSCPREVWRWLCIPLALYFAERLFRIICSKRNAATIEGFQIHSDNVIELRLSQHGFAAKPGQTVLVRCPSISQVELHSFSLSSVPSKDDPTFGLHIKVLGDWTGKLREILLQQSLDQEDKLYSPIRYEKKPAVGSALNCNREDYDVESSVQDKTEFVDPLRFNSIEDLECRTGNFSLNEVEIYDNCETVTQVFSHEFDVAQNHLYFTKNYDELTKKDCESKSEISDNFKPHRQCSIPVYVEGPFGSAMEDIHKYKVSLCVAGGIGITPFASVLNSFLKDQIIWSKTKIQRIYLLWACRDIQSFQCLENVLESLQIKLWKENRPDFLSIQLHATGNQDSESIILSSALSRCALTFSRPKFDEVVRDISRRHPKCTVGVFSCGPRSLVAALKKSCLHTSTRNKTKFVFNKEAF